VPTYCVMLCPLLGDRQHAARPAAWVVDRAHDTLAADAIRVAGQHQVHHEMHDIARREVLAGILVEGLVELPDQFFEDRSHCGVVDL